MTLLERLAGGWRCIPVPARSKNPGRREWQNEEHAATAIEAHVRAGGNVGVLLGERSNNLVDVDLDAPEALASADAFVPATECEFGRASKPRAHRLLKSESSIPTRQFHDVDGTMLVEIRSTGAQTIILGTHPGGEAIEWTRNGEPASVTGAELLSQVAKLAAAAMLARHWPEVGARHDASLALAGWLLRHDWEIESVTHFLSAVVCAAHDEEPVDRLRGVISTAQRLAAGGAATGAPTLAEFVGSDVVERASEWLVLQGAVPTSDEPHLTDLGNAKRLVRRHGKDLLYCGARGGWFVWRGMRWEPDNAEAIRRAKETILALYGEAERISDSDRRKAHIEWAMKSESERALNAMVALASTESGMTIAHDQWDADLWAFNVKNGTIDLRTGRLHDHRRADLLTRLSPVVYDPNATHPMWDKFLHDTMSGDLEMVAFLQRLVGYTLTGDLSEEKLIFAQGPEASGKSTFMEAIKTVLGDYAVTADFETFVKRRAAGNARSDLARLAGARFVASVEVDEGATLAEAVVKMMTGGDTITARFLYKEFFEFTPQCTLWLAANDAPRVRDDDSAMWRRIIRVLFDHTVPEEQRDPNVKATLRNPGVAGPAILAWAVAGCLGWQRDGLAIPKKVKDATEEYRAEMDPLPKFLEDCCYVDPNAQVGFDVLWRAYQAWIDESGETERRLTKRQFGKRLSGRGYRADKGTNGLRIRRGIGLHPVWTPA